MFKNCTEAQAEFENCWKNQVYTQIELDDIDVNQTLLHYIAAKPVHFTKEMLWDMEKKKAWNPGKYIPHVVREGSAQSWEKQSCPSTGDEIFVRCSQQKQWLHPDVYEEVYEEVYVNNKDQLITFLGVRSLPGRPGKLLPKQPLFHVQHSAAGLEERPLNKWRIVHLTEAKDFQLIAFFKDLNNPAKLPGYIKEYIEKDLHVALQHK